MCGIEELREKTRQMAQYLEVQDQKKKMKENEINTYIYIYYNDKQTDTYTNVFFASIVLQLVNSCMCSVAAHVQTINEYVPLQIKKHIWMQYS